MSRNMMRYVSPEESYVSRDMTRYFSCERMWYVSRKRFMFVMVWCVVSKLSDSRKIVYIL